MMINWEDINFLSFDFLGVFFQDRLWEVSLLEFRIINLFPYNSISYELEREMFQTKAVSPLEFKLIDISFFILFWQTI